jgi:hypothetical protein
MRAFATILQKIQTSKISTLNKLGILKFKLPRTKNKYRRRELLPQMRGLFLGQ